MASCVGAELDVLDQFHNDLSDCLFAFRIVYIAASCCGIPHFINVFVKQAPCLDNSTIAEDVFHHSTDFIDCDVSVDNLACVGRRVRLRGVFWNLHYRGRPGDYDGLFTAEDHPGLKLFELLTQVFLVFESFLLVETFLTVS